MERLFEQSTRRNSVAYSRKPFNELKNDLQDSINEYNKKKDTETEPWKENMETKMIQYINDMNRITKTNDEKDIFKKLIENHKDLFVSPRGGRKSKKKRKKGRRTFKRRFSY